MTTHCNVLEMLTLTNSQEHHTTHLTSGVSSTVGVLYVYICLWRELKPTAHTNIL